ncbi:MAG: hypothetical protein ABL897_06200 [Hyphomicrobium sp.]
MRSGTPGFLRFAENLVRVRSIQADINEEKALQRSTFRASLVDEPLPQPSNLMAVFAQHRARVSGF